MTDGYLVHHRQIESHDPRLNRHVNHDSRSRDYPAEMASAVRDVLWPSRGLPLNQGPIGKCTAEAACGRCNSAPWQSEHLYTDADSDTLYEAETALEGSPWSPADPTVNDIGGSGLTVCKAAQNLGWIRSYDHAFSTDDALRALGVRPGITGTHWYESMFRPDSNGLVEISAGSSIAGGHEYLVDQVLVEQRLIGCWNSWGPEFGVGGRFYMSWTTWDRLLNEEGDVTFIHMPDPTAAS